MIIETIAPRDDPGGRQRRVGARKAGIDGQRSSEQSAAFIQIKNFDGGPVAGENVGTSHEILVGPPACRRLQQRALGLCPVDVRDQCGGDRAGEFVLKREHIRELAIVAFGPTVGAGERIDELRGDPHAAVVAAKTAYQHVAHAELASDLPDVDCLPLVLKARIACDDEQFREA